MIANPFAQVLRAERLQLVRLTHGGGLNLRASFR